MIQVSIIVQLREVSEDGTKLGRMSFGIRQFQQQNHCPQKSWREQFDAAVREAQLRRVRMLEEAALDARPAPAEQTSLAFQRPAKKGVPPKGARP